MQSVSRAKTEKYIPYILEDLGFNNERPTTLYCDNITDIVMIN